MQVRFPAPMLLDSVTSTNDFLKKFVEPRAPRAVLARRQTRGRGRHGRNWYSEPDLGLYVSYLFFPDLAIDLSERLNTVSALAVALTVEELCPGLLVELKRPNDVLLNQRKVAGVLVEMATQGGRIHWTIIGIGINLSQKTFPFGGEPHPTSLLLEGIEAPPQGQIYDILTRYLVRLLRECRSGLWDPVQEEFERRLWQSKHQVKKP